MGISIIIVTQSDLSIQDNVSHCLPNNSVVDEMKMCNSVNNTDIAMELEFLAKFAYSCIVFILESVIFPSLNN